MKKIVFLTSVLLVFLSFILYTPDYSAVPSSVGLVTITQEETKKLIKEDDIAIYVGRDTCPDCQRIMPKLKKQLKNNKKTLYYFDTTAKGEKLFHYRKFYNSLGVKAVPSIIIAKNGKVKKVFNLEKDQTSLSKIIKEEI